MFHLHIPQLLLLLTAPIQKGMARLSQSGWLVTSQIVYLPQMSSDPSINEA